MSYLLYYSPGSSNIVVRMVLEELGVAYTDKQVARKGSERDTEFLRLNPRGLVPVIVDESHDVVIFETGAIILYLADRIGRLAPFPGRRGVRADCLKWLFMLSNTLHADLNMRFYREQYVKDQADVSAFLETNRRRVLGHFELMDKLISEHAGSTFLASGLSICDFYLGCLVRWAQIYPRGEAALRTEELLKLENLTRVLCALQRRPSVRRALEREGLSGPAFVNPAPAPQVSTDRTAVS